MKNLSLAPMRLLAAVLVVTAAIAVGSAQHPQVGIVWSADFDPTTAGGVNAPLWQFLIRTDSPSIYYKSGSSNTGWTLLGVGGGGGDITGVTTAIGSGLQGGCTSGTCALSMLATCTPTQVLAWTGAAWACSTPSTGITNSAGNNVVPKSNGTNLVPSQLTDDATTVSVLGGIVSNSPALSVKSNTGGSAFYLQAPAITSNAATMRWLNSVGDLRWSMGPNSTIGTVRQDFWLFDNLSSAYYLYLDSTVGGTASFLRFGSTNGRVSYNDTTHDLTLSTNGSTRGTIGDAAATFSVPLAGSTIVTGGASGPEWSSAAGAPIGACTTGDLYTNTTAGTLYYCIATVWTAIGTGSSSLTNSAGTNVMTKSNGTNLVASSVTDDGTTWAISTNKFTCVEASGNCAAAGTFASTGALSGSTVSTGGASGPKWSSAAGAPVGACTTGALYTDTTAGTLYYCIATVWTAIGTGSGTLTGALTSPGVAYATGASVVATDAADFAYNAASNLLRIGTAAVTAATTNPLSVTTGTTDVGVGNFWNTNASGYSGMTFGNTSGTYQGGVGFANSTVAATALRSLNYFVSSGPDFVFNDLGATSTNLYTMFMTSGSTGLQMTNGASGGVGAANTGKLQYSSTAQAFRVSNNGAAFLPVATQAVTSTVFPKSSSSTSGAMGTSLLADSGTQLTYNTTSLVMTTGGKATITQGTSVFSVETNNGSIGLIQETADSDTAAASSWNTYNAGSSSVVTLTRSRGTKASPVAVSSGDTLGSLRYFGQYDTTASHTYEAATVAALADATPASSVVPGRIEFKTSSATALATRFTIDRFGHFKSNPSTTNVPGTPTSCGGSPAVDATSTDNGGEITEGSAATGCVIPFGSTWGTKPNCTVTAQSGLGFSYTLSTTAITITNIGALSSTKINWTCW